MWAKMETQCKQIDSIQTQALKVNPVGTGETEGSRKYGSVEERWIVNICNKEIPFLVTFTPDGQGGAFFSTSLEK
jgi:hypothetical protein